MQTKTVEVLACLRVHHCNCFCLQILLIAIAIGTNSTSNAYSYLHLVRVVFPAALKCEFTGYANPTLWIR
jgi:hypothetical protein